LPLACGGGAQKCTTPLAAAHLTESFCAGGAGFCFFDHDIPF
jgi:hypothetical protein